MIEHYKQGRKEHNDVNVKGGGGMKHIHTEVDGWVASAQPSTV